MRWLTTTLIGLLAALLAALVYISAIVATSLWPSAVGDGSGAVAVRINGFVLIGVMAAGCAAGVAWSVRRRARRARARHADPPVS